MASYFGEQKITLPFRKLFVLLILVSYIPFASGCAQNIMFAMQAVQTVAGMIASNRENAGRGDAYREGKPYVPDSATQGWSNASQLAGLGGAITSFGASNFGWGSGSSAEKNGVTMDENLHSSQGGRAEQVAASGKAHNLEQLSEVDGSLFDGQKGEEDVFVAGSEGSDGVPDFQARGDAFNNFSLSEDSTGLKGPGYNTVPDSEGSNGVPDFQARGDAFNNFDFDFDKIKSEAGSQNDSDSVPDFQSRGDAFNNFNFDTIKSEAGSKSDVGSVVNSGSILNSGVDNGDLKTYASKTDDSSNLLGSIKLNDNRDTGGHSMLVKSPISLPDELPAELISKTESNDGSTIRRTEKADGSLTSITNKPTVSEDWIIGKNRHGNTTWIKTPSISGGSSAHNDDELPAELISKTESNDGSAIRGTEKADGSFTSITNKPTVSEEWTIGKDRHGNTTWIKTSSISGGSSAQNDDELSAVKKRVEILDDRATEMIRDHEDEEWTRQYNLKLETEAKAAQIKANREAADEAQHLADQKTKHDLELKRAVKEYNKNGSVRLTWNYHHLTKEELEALGHERSVFEAGSDMISSATMEHIRERNEIAKAEKKAESDKAYQDRIDSYSTNTSEEESSIGNLKYVYLILSGRSDEIPGNMNRDASKKKGKNSGTYWPK